MSDREVRELTAIRFELRERLIARGDARAPSIEALLTRMAALAGGDAELARELERWRLRFELLGMIAIPVAA